MHSHFWIASISHQLPTPNPIFALCSHSNRCCRNCVKLMEPLPWGGGEFSGNQKKAPGGGSPRLPPPGLEKGGSSTPPPSVVRERSSSRFSPSPTTPLPLPTLVTRFFELVFLSALGISQNVPRFFLFADSGHLCLGSNRYEKQREPDREYQRQKDRKCGVPKISCSAADIFFSKKFSQYKKKTKGMCNFRHQLFWSQLIMIMEED